MVIFGCIKLLEWRTLIIDAHFATFVSKSMKNFQYSPVMFSCKKFT